MSFQPIIPTSGLVGWSFLKRTQERQSGAFQSSSTIIRDTEYFEAKIGDVKTAADLVSDRRLLRVALGAFGLQDDIDNRYFVRKLLEDGTLSQDALSNKMADDRYKGFSKAFGFGDFDTPRTQLSYFGKEITNAFRERQFEVAVGYQEDDFRLAMNFEREIVDIATGNDSEDTKWFRIMGNPPLRSVFEIALGLPNSFGQLDLDRQLEGLRQKMDQLTGNSEISQFVDKVSSEKLVQRFLLRSQMSAQTTYSSNQVALSMLRSIPSQQIS